MDVSQSRTVESASVSALPSLLLSPFLLDRVSRLFSTRLALLIPYRLEKRPAYFNTLPLSTVHTSVSHLSAHSTTMSSAIAPSSVAGDMMSDAAASRRGDDEAEEEGAAGARPGAGKGGKNRVRIARDQGDVPPVRDDTGEKVTELFQQFLEQ